MDWSAQVFRYCERGADPAFWGEPLNAISNGAFIIAALLAAIELQRRRDLPQPSAAWLLTGVVFVIGIGSFLFHTFATRWASIGDVAPIGIFMLAYLGYALRGLLGLGWVATAIGLAAFVAAMQGFDGITCSRTGLLGIAEASQGACLNGSMAYAPALLAMLAIGGALGLQRHPAARYLLGAGSIFLVSLTFRSVDMEVCALTRVAGKAVGTHFLWHVCNAITLYLLLAAAIRTSGPSGKPKAIA